MTETIFPIFENAFDLGILAQAQASGLVPQLKKLISIIRMIAYFLAVASLVVSAISFSLGRVESAIYGVAAAGILALSATIVKAAFEATGDDFDL